MTRFDMTKFEKLKTKKARAIGITILVIIIAAAAFIAFPRPVMAPAEDEVATPVSTETVSAEAEPSPTERQAYIPEPDELQAIPVLGSLTLTEGYITSETTDAGLNVSWTGDNGADYNLLCILDAEGNVLQKDILRPDITEWNFTDYTGAGLLLISYKDMGEDSAGYDTMLGAYYVEVAAPEPTPTETAKPTTKPTHQAASPTPAPTETLNKYFIIVDKSDNTFAVFTYDENGEYTDKVVQFPCALGRTSRLTPVGTFTIGKKGAWKAWAGDEFSPYYTAFDGVYIHGPLYDEKDGSTLIVKRYNEIGTNASSGCVRTTTAGAYWVYANCPAGTKIQVVADSSLVSRQSLPPIDPNYPTWDPTDPNKPSAPPATPTSSEPPAPSESAVASETVSAGPSDAPRRSSAVRSTRPATLWSDCPNRCMLRSGACCGKHGSWTMPIRPKS
jgi:lipoprotein-anchoring transpeptidase ErfK/SrfK